MVDIKAKYMWLPYSGLVTKFLKHVIFNLEGDEADHEYIGIWSDTLNQMEIDSEYEVLSYRFGKVNEKFSSEPAPP